MIDLIVLPQQKAFGEAKRDTLPRFCLECDVRFACHGGCPKDRFTHDARRRARASTTCVRATRTSSGTSVPTMDAMCELLRADRAPSELVAVYAAEDAARGRNEPCTCGSGRKWKHCHGA